MTDRWFPRHSPFQTWFTTLSPDELQIENALDRLDFGPDGIQAIIPLHAHFDHAMDAPVVATLTGGKRCAGWRINGCCPTYLTPHVVLREELDGERGKSKIDRRRSRFLFHQ